MDHRGARPRTGQLGGPASRGLQGVVSPLGPWLFAQGAGLSSSRLQGNLGLPCCSVAPSP
eukprot:1178264-Prorocentrum_minimum.AAC.1